MSGKKSRKQAPPGEQHGARGSPCFDAGGRKAKTSPSGSAE